MLELPIAAAHLAKVGASTEAPSVRALDCRERGLDACVRADASDPSAGNCDRASRGDGQEIRKRGNARLTKPMAVSDVGPPFPHDDDGFGRFPKLPTLQVVNLVIADASQSSYAEMADDPRVAL